MWLILKQLCAKAPVRRLNIKTLAVVVAASASGLLLAGCGSIGPHPWERDLMAKREMQVDPYPLQTSASEHIYFSKEASSGGRGFAGGGCGCN